MTVWAIWEEFVTLEKGYAVSNGDEHNLFTFVAMEREIQFAAIHFRSINTGKE